ncbi:DNA fragmentation factor subunit beta [Contarinia nasturtii]|uniref:DNA fragmentation factor subunit beta n=1 Tax=Contarinia nasturtii TaxID=265458 RepID=UPI0012D38DC0|nr:DNA fragmentation factor subunit beta [Contarinia nasturtii]
MFGLFGSFKRPLKGYKITTIDRKKKYGVAADSLQMLKDKASVKLKIENCRVFLARDGTEIQDDTYFATIEPQTLFVIATDVHLVKTDFQLMYEAIRSVHAHTFNAAETIQNFITDNRSEFEKFFVNYQANTKNLIEKTQASNRIEHSEWFEGVSETLHTKEDVMARRSQDRIRGYYYKAKDELQNSSIYRTNANARKLLDDLLEMFQYFLIGVDYFSSLFNRKCENRHQFVLELENNDDIDGTRGPPRKKVKVDAIRDIISETDLKENYCVSLCNEQGEFRCHGLWSSQNCQYKNHRINPYASRENVILFSQWNLDHQIEISRTVLPNILNNVHAIVIDKVKCEEHKKPACQLSAMEYFLELFTIQNLKLVHIVCHDKATHDLSSTGKILCDECKEYQFIQNIMGKMKKIGK